MNECRRFFDTAVSSLHHSNVCDFFFFVVVEVRPKIHSGKYSSDDKMKKKKNVMIWGNIILQSNNLKTLSAKTQSRTKKRVSSVKFAKGNFHQPGTPAPFAVQNGYTLEPSLLTPHEPLRYWLAKSISYPFFSLFYFWRTINPHRWMHLGASYYFLSRIVLLIPVVVSRLSLQGSGPGRIRVPKPRNRMFT